MRFQSNPYFVIRSFQPNYGRSDFCLKASNNNNDSGKKVEWLRLKWYFMRLHVEWHPSTCECECRRVKSEERNEGYKIRLHCMNLTAKYAKRNANGKQRIVIHKNLSHCSSISISIGISGRVSFCKQLSIFFFCMYEIHERSGVSVLFLKRGSVVAFAKR